MNPEERLEAIGMMAEFESVQEQLTFAQHRLNNAQTVFYRISYNIGAVIGNAEKVIQKFMEGGDVA